MKTQRQAKLVELIRQGEIASQSDARKQLSRAGFSTTQATVSRDLEEIGAVRVRSAGGIRYSLQTARSEFGVNVARVLRDLVVGRTASGNIVVLRTPPGHAGAVASAIDRAQLPGVIGTIAGDDTVFLCATEKIGGKGVLKVLTEAAEN